MTDDCRGTEDPESSTVDWWTMLTDPAFLASPYQDLKRIRERGAIHRDPVSGVFFVLGYQEFRAMATAREMGRDTRLWTNGWNREEVRQNDRLTYTLFSEFQPQMTNANSPHHRRMRGVYEKAYRPAALATYGAMINAESERLLETAPVGKAFDFMETVANPLSRSLARITFGIPPEMEEQVAHWVADLGFIANIMMSQEQKQNAQRSLREFKQYLRELMAADDNKREESFLALTRRAIADGTMNEEEGLNNLVTLVAGGTATASLLGNGLLALLRHPEQFEKLRANQKLMAPAIEEMLRFEPGCSIIIRVAIDDYQCGGTSIPKGSLAIGLMAATNRDPCRFENPDVFDIARQPNAQQVFGVGQHICLGKSLVRQTAEILFTDLMNHFDHIELAGEPVWWSHRSDQHGLHKLPIKLGTLQ